MAFTKQEVIFYTVMWVFTFTAGICRTLRDKDYGSVWDCLAVGGVGGFYGFSIVALCSSYGPDIAVFGWPYIGLSTAIGLLGKEQDKVTRQLFIAVFERVFGGVKKE